MEVDIPLEEEPVEIPLTGTLVPKLSEYFITENKPRIVFADHTGLYSEENPGGYGRPNHTRDEVALLLSCVYKAVAGDEVMEFAPYSQVQDTYSTDNPQSFLLDLPKDGWLQTTLYVFEAPAFATAEMVADGKVIWDRDAFALRRKVGEELVPVTLEEASAYALASHTTDEFPVVNNAYHKQTKGEEATNLIPHSLEDESCFELDRAIRKYNIHNIGLATAVWAFCKGEKYLAQKDIEVLNQIIARD